MLVRRVLAVLLLALASTGHVRAREPSSSGAADFAAWNALVTEDLARREATWRRLEAHRGGLVGVELLIAEGTRRPVQSRWGHAMLRFVDGGDPFDDAVLAFVAAPDGPRLSLWKGLVGGYPVVPELGSLAWALGAYVRDQLRPVSRWVVPTSAEERARTVGTLDRWRRQPELGGTYTFAGNNCAWAMARFLAEAGVAPLPAPDVLASHVPTQLAGQLRDHLRPAPSIPTPGELLASVAESLATTSEALRAGRWPPATDTLLAFSPMDRRRVILNLDPPPEVVDALLASLPADTPMDLSEAYGVRALPDDAYRRAETTNTH